MHSAILGLLLLLLVGCGGFRGDARAALIPPDGRYALITDPARQDQAWGPGAVRWQALRSAPDRQHDSVAQGHARIDLAAGAQVVPRPVTGFTGFQVMAVDPDRDVRAGTDGLIEIRRDGVWTAAAMDAQGVLTLQPGPAQLVPWPLITARVSAEADAAKAAWVSVVAARPKTPPPRAAPVVPVSALPVVAAAPMPVVAPVASAAPAEPVLRPEDDGALPEVPFVLSVEEARQAHAAIVAAMKSRAPRPPAVRADLLARTLVLRGFAAGYLRANPDSGEMRAMAADLDHRERLLRGL